MRAVRSIAMRAVDLRGVAQIADSAGEEQPGRAQRTVNLGRGVIVPYPEPTGLAATKIGRANRRTDTKPEVLLRSALHRRGRRFRKDHLLRLDSVRVRPDIVFSRRRIAVFIDGCFWHGCPDHSNVPKRNVAYWIPKLQANVDRDRRVSAALIESGWAVIRLWEHVPLDEALTIIENALDE